MPPLIDGIFWGILLIAVGAWFVLRHALPVRIPVLRLIVAVILIYLGIRVLVNRPLGGYVFPPVHQKYVQGWDRDYTILFGSGDVDLSGVRAQTGDVRTQVNVVFGSGVLRVDPRRPVRVEMSSAFGEVQAPDGRTVSFGSSVYTSAAYRDGAPALVVRATAVFGSLHIIGPAGASP